MMITRNTHRDGRKVTTEPGRRGRVGEQRRRAVVLHGLGDIPVKRGSVDCAQTLLLAPDEMATFPGLRRAGGGGDVASSRDIVGIGRRGLKRKLASVRSVQVLAAVQASSHSL